MPQKGYYKFLERKALETEVVLNDAQIELSEKYVKPKIDELYFILKKERDRFDEEINKIKNSKKILSDTRKGCRNVNEYPIGCCDWIAENLFFKTKKLEPFKELKNKGVEIRWIFGSMYDSFFQNALQIGDYFFDVAHDTVCENWKKIKFNKMQDVEFKQTPTLEHESFIKNSYYDVEIVPNFYLPTLSLFYSVFTIDHENKSVSLDINSSRILNADIKSKHKMSKKFFIDGKYAKNRLPKAAEKN